MVRVRVEFLEKESGTLSMHVLDQPLNFLPLHLPCAVVVLSERKTRMLWYCSIHSERGRLWPEQGPIQVELLGVP